MAQQVLPGASGLRRSGAAGYGGAGAVLPAIHNALEGGTGPRMPGVTGGGTATAPPAAAAGAGGNPMVDLFRGYLTSDQGYQSDVSYYKALANNAALARDRANNQLMIQYGLTPDLTAGASAFGFTPAQTNALLATENPATRAAAEAANQAGISVLGQLNMSNTNALNAIRANLAARGMIGSGGETFQNAQQAHAYNLGMYNALSRLYSAYTGNEDRYQALMQQMYGPRGQLYGSMINAWKTFVPAVESGQVPLPRGMTLQQLVNYRLPSTAPGAPAVPVSPP